MHTRSDNIFVVTAAYGLMLLSFAASANADDATADVQDRVIQLTVSDRVILKDAVYKLVLREAKLCLEVQDLTNGGLAKKVIPTSYKIPEGATVSQVELTNFRDKGLIAALKLKRGGKFEFVEMAFWSKAADQTLNGECSSSIFLTTEEKFDILAISSRRSRGIFIVVGKDSYSENPPGLLTQGFLFLDGCPWPCMGGALTPIKGLAPYLPDDSAIKTD